MANILVVDDSAVHRAAYEQILASSHRITLAADGKQGRELVVAGGFDLLITDVIMPDVSGFDLIQYTREHAADMKIMAISGASFPGTTPTEFLSVAQFQGADGVLAKPFKPAELLAAVDQILTE